MASVGVMLPDWFGDAGDYLADARALEEAGVHSLWLKAGVGRSRLDPNMMLAGIAAVTSRVKLGLMISSNDATGTPDVALETLHRLSRARPITGRTVRGGKELIAGPQPVVRIAVAPVPANPAPGRRHSRRPRTMPASWCPCSPPCSTCCGGRIKWRIARICS